MISRSTIDKIYATAKIEEVVADYVTLRRRGANYQGLCPFHSEKTPSFNVNPARGIFKCFGCGEAGNAVGFVMKIDSCSYAEALRHIAAKYHIPVEERELSPEEEMRHSDRESMFAVNEWANKWFREQLWETQEGQAIGLSYFHERGLQDTTIRKFGLGFAPSDGNPMTAAAQAEGYTEQYLVNDPETRIGTGIVGKSDNGRLYDRFRDRVIFPIYTTSGKTVAFAGRILRKKFDKEGKEIPQGKYVNSPDSIIYSKTNELYGLFQAKQAISRNDLCYLVEGQMDVLSMHQAGIENVVSSGGTALTTPQIRLIKRFTSNITVLYDGDAAGIHAALRGIDMFLQEGFNVKVVLLPDGEDPDSYAQSHDSSEFIEYIKQQQTDFIRFKAQLSWQEAADDPSKRSELIHDLVQSLSLIPDDITRAVYVRDCAERLGTSEALLTKEVNHLRYQRGVEADKRRMENERQANMVRLMGKGDGAQQQQAEQGAASVSEQKLTRMQQNIRNLLQVMVRHGEKPLYRLADRTITVGEFILTMLDQAKIEPELKADLHLLHEYRKAYKEDGFVAEDYFKFHSDPEINQLACNLLTDKYQLSTMFSKQMVSENVQQSITPADESELLMELVPKLVSELNLTIIEERIADVNKQMHEATKEGKDEQVMSLLAKRTDLDKQKKTLLEYLGRK